MKLPSYPKAPQRAHQAKGALFVDLDETLLRGTVTRMTDEELLTASLDERILSLIRETRMQGLKVVLVTRNQEYQAERFFRAFPEVRSLFSAVFASTSSLKSEPIQEYIRQNDISAARSQFVDDNSSERGDVEDNVKGITAVHPLHAISLKRIRPSVQANDVNLFAGFTNRWRAKYRNLFKERFGMLMEEFFLSSGKVFHDQMTPGLEEFARQF